MALDERCIEESIRTSDGSYVEFTMFPDSERHRDKPVILTVDPKEEAALNLGLTIEDFDLIIQGAVRFKERIAGEVAT